MKTLIVLIVTIISSTLALSAQSSTNTETQKIVDEFFKVYKKKGHKEAVSELLATNKWISEASAFEVSTKLAEVVDQIGEFQGHEKIKESKYGNSMIHYTYLVKYDRQPLRFLFRFYRPDDKWQTQGFEYEVEFSDDLDEKPKNAEN